MTSFQIVSHGAVTEYIDARLLRDACLIGFVAVECFPALIHVLIGVLAALQTTTHGQVVHFVHPDAELCLIKEPIARLVGTGKRLVELVLERLPDLITAIFSRLAQLVLKVLLRLLLLLGHRCLLRVVVVDEPLEERLLPLELLVSEQRLSIPTSLNLLFLFFDLGLLVLLGIHGTGDGLGGVGLDLLRQRELLLLATFIGARFDNGLWLGFNHFRFLFSEGKCDTDCDSGLTN